MSTTTVTRPATTVSVADHILAAYNRDADAAFLVADLMEITGKSRTTVTDNLRKLAAVGAVIRMDKDKVTTWSLTPTRKAAIKRAAKKATAAAPKTTKTVRKPSTPKAATAPKGNRKMSDTTAETTGDSATRTPTGRRLKGAIDAEILGYFSANPDPAGSYTVAKAIGSSSGAAYVALKRMDREGSVRLVSQEPDRYQAA